MLGACLTSWQHEKNKNRFEININKCYPIVLWDVYLKILYILFIKVK